VVIYLQYILNRQPQYSFDQAIVGTSFGESTKPIDWYDLNLVQLVSIIKGYRLLNANKSLFYTCTETNMLQKVYYYE